MEPKHVVSESQAVGRVEYKLRCTFALRHVCLKRSVVDVNKELLPIVVGACLGVFETYLSLLVKGTSSRLVYVLG